MEGILQDSRAAQITPPDFSAQVLFFPVRHHSPVCAYQLRQAAAAYQPECILIEGPENANDLIGVLTDAHTRMPAAIYYFYKDKKKYVSEDARDYHCYYPFLESSPEYAAMQTAKEMGIPARFIDLPYSEILIHTGAERGLRSEQERHSYADDSRLVQSRFYQELCEKTGLRSFEEFWEQYFEIRGLRMTPADFMHQMLVYCTLTRDATPAEQMEEDGTLAREQHMAMRIREALGSFSRILVVTGGFHSPGLAGRIAKPVKPLRLHKFTDDLHGCYPIAYSYAAADALAGYASGMPHPYFYDRITQGLAASGSPEGVYSRTVLSLLTETAKACSDKDLPLSIADVTAAWTVTQGLAALRESPEPGYAEGCDGVTAALIKGEKTPAASLPLQMLHKLATGDGVGHIGDQSHVPPLIQDFEQQAKLLRLKTDTAIPQEADIALFKSERELQKSRFFHRMDFLGTAFGKMRKGPDLHANRDRSRVHELWGYCRTPQVDAVLVDRTTDGTTLAEACRNLASRRLREERRCEIAAHVCVDCFLMGIPLDAADTAVMEEILANDGDFFSVGSGLHAFDMLRELRALYGFEDPANLRYLEQCFTKLTALLPSMAGVDAAQAEGCIRIMRLLYGITGSTLPERRGELCDALEAMTLHGQKEPSVYGAALGLLYATDSTWLLRAEQAMQGYLAGSPEYRKQGALYLRGLFETARDIALTDVQFLHMTDALLAEMDYEDFMEILPPLRLAFSYFTPGETQTIAGEVAGLHGKDARHVLQGDSVDEMLAAFGAELDASIFRTLREEDA
ncbi:MAG: hypothetical protein IJV58_04405 [Oscillospiraceae bacterium]|nr:hypothetical protein [Oscillospiraceae bacterium]